MLRLNRASYDPVKPGLRSNKSMQLGPGFQTPQSNSLQEVRVRNSSSVQSGVKMPSETVLPAIVSHSRQKYETSEYISAPNVSNGGQQ